MTTNTAIYNSLNTLPNHVVLVLLILSLSFLLVGVIYFLEKYRRRMFNEISKMIEEKKRRKK